MKKFIMMSAVTVCMTASAFAMAGNNEMNKDMKMERMEMKISDKMAMMDTNNDGMVSKTEMRDHSDTMFEKADTDKDGMVSKDEMMKSMKSMKMEHHEMEHHDMKKREKR